MSDIVEMLRQGEKEGVDGWWSTMANAADEIEKLHLIIAQARGELAQLIPRPSQPTLEDWPVSNPGDAECLQAAFTKLTI